MTLTVMEGNVISPQKLNQDIVLARLEGMELSV